MFQRCLILIVLAPAVLAFKHCDSTVKLDGNETYTVWSPLFPRNYPAGSSCHYHFIAPRDYTIKVVCVVELPLNNCADKFYVDVDGDYTMSKSKTICGKANVVMYSPYERLDLLYKSKGTGGGRFQCTLTNYKETCKCGWSSESGHQSSTQGTQAKVGEFPSMAAMVKEDHSGKRHKYCGGTIVTHRYIVTHSFCLDHQVDPETHKRRYIVVGTVYPNNPASSNYYREYEIAETKRHYYLGVVETSESMAWNYAVGPACLPPKDSTHRFDNEAVELAGFGLVKEHSNGLHKVNMIVMAKGELCPQKLWLCVQDLKNSSSGVCTRDGGGPVYVRKDKLFFIGVLNNPYHCSKDHSGIDFFPKITNDYYWLLKFINYEGCERELN